MGRVYTDWRDTPDDPNRVGDEDYDPYPMPQREDEDEEGEDFCQACEDGTCSELTTEEKGYE